MLTSEEVKKISMPLSLEINEVIVKKLGAEAFSGSDLTKFIDAQNIASAALVNCISTYLAQSSLILSESSKKETKVVMDSILQEFLKNVKSNLEREVPLKVQRVLDMVKKIVFN